MTEPRPLNIRIPAAAQLPEIPDTIQDPAAREYLFDLKRQLSKLLDHSRTVVTDGQSPPVLHVARAAAQSLTAATPAKVQFDTTRYDTHGYWDATNFRYFPKIAGYYRVSWSVKFDEEAAGCNVVTAALYVDGVADKSVDIVNPTTTAGVVAANSTVVYCDGSTRYLEVWAAVTASTTIAADKAYTFLSVEFVGDNYPGVVTGADTATGLGAGGTGGCTISSGSGGGFSGACWLSMVGAGGGGGSTTAVTQGGGGGGGGESCDGLLIYLTPGGSFSYSVGVGGTSDGNGGNTTFDVFSCLGGGKGQPGSTTGTGGVGGGAQGAPSAAAATRGEVGGAEAACFFGGSGGGGGQAGTGPSKEGGGSGGYTTGGAGTSHASGSGGGGAASIYSNGGNGGGGAAGVSATGYGGGGGGAGGIAGGAAGGSGSGGYILITWVGGSQEYTSGSGTFTAPAS